MRGLILEGLGVAVLVFLYVSMQSTGSPPADLDAVEKTEAPSVQQPAPAPSLSHGRYAQSWVEYSRETRSRMNYPGSPAFSIGSVNTIGF